MTPLALIVLCSVPVLHPDRVGQGLVHCAANDAEHGAATIERILKVGASAWWSDLEEGGREAMDSNYFTNSHPLSHTSVKAKTGFALHGR